MNISLHIFTNCTEKYPLDNLLRTYNSFCDAFGKMEPTIWIDPNPNNLIYKTYLKDLTKHFKILHTTTSLSDGYIQAIKYYKTDYLFMLEHDWIFRKENIKHSLYKIMDAMQSNGIYHLRFNKRVNEKTGWDFKISECGDDNFKFCKTNNVSNNPHILHRKTGLEWIKKEWIKIMPGSKGIEERHLKNSETWGAIYGGLNYPQTIQHLNTRG